MNSGDRPVYLVTGASGAIGLEIAGRAAAAGISVAVHGASTESAATAVTTLGKEAPDAGLMPVAANFHDAGAIQQLVESVVGAFGRLDAVIHCAITGARGVTGPFRDTDPASYGEHIALVLGSFQQLCFHAMPHLSERGGAIVTLASDAGRFAAPRQSVVGAANGGITSFVRSLALEASREGVRVNGISLSFVADTPTFEKYGAGGRGDTAQQRAGLGLPTPGDIAPLALFLCSPGAGKITGQVISVNGGLNA